MVQPGGGQFGGSVTGSPIAKRLIITRSLASISPLQLRSVGEGENPGAHGLAIGPSGSPIVARFTLMMSAASMSPVQFVSPQSPPCVSACVIPGATIAAPSASTSNSFFKEHSPY